MNYKKNSSLEEIDFQLSLVDNVVSKSINDIYSILYLKKDMEFSIEDINKYYTIIYNHLVDDEEDKNAKKLYEIYCNQLESFYSNTILPILDKSNDFISELGNFYSCDQECIKYLSSLILRYLERYYIKNNGIKNIQEKSKEIFKKIIYLKYENKIINLTVENLNNYRKYEFEQNIIINLFTIITLFNKLDENHIIYKSIEQYTILFFQNFKQDILDKGNYGEYYIEIEKAFFREENLFQNILSSSLYEYYIKFLNQLIILKNIENYNKNNYISKYIRNRDYEQLIRLYKLVKKVEKEEEIISPVIISSFEEETKELEYSSINIENYILDLIELNKSYNNIFISFHTKNDIVLKKMIYEYKKNLSKYTSKEIIIKNKKYSIVKLFITHINYYLTKKQSLVDTDFINNYLNIIFIMEEKDYYLELYSIYLSKRLLFSKYDIDKETEILHYLKKNMGFTATIKIENMIKDIMFHQNEVNKKYKVLTLSQWPIYKNTKCILSNEIKNILEKFTEEYNNKFSQRKIYWNNDISTVTINLNLDIKYQITMSFIEHSIINLYMTKIQYTYQEIKDQLSIDKEEYIIYIKNLVNSKLLISSEEEINNDTIITFNKDFKSNKIRFTLPMPLIEKSQDENQNKKIVNEDRSENIKASIVRIMKTKKSLSHNNLIIEVTKNINLFTPSIKDIKKCIENLIEREYLERSTEHQGTYNYLA